MTESTMTKTIILNAKPDVVWSFLTDKDKLGQWFFPAEADLAEGEEYALMGAADDGTPQKMCWGKVITMNKPDSMVWSFTIGPLNGAMTTLHWSLDDCNEGTRVTLRHEGINQAAGEAALGLLLALDGGWDAHFGKLRGAVSAIAESA